MTRVLKIGVFAGDGIGPEIMAPTLNILEQVATRDGSFRFTFEELSAGATCYRETGESLPETSLERAKQADAILLSAMGDPSIRYSNGTEIVPQIELRIALELIAGLRPVRIAKGYPTPLKRAVEGTVDFVLVRESTEGLFASLGKGIVEEDRATETLEITRAVCDVLFQETFRLAETRRKRGIGKGKVTCIDKANVFSAFAYFRRLFQEHAQAYPDLITDAQYVDLAALRMVQAPGDYDVMVTENMFGDILSDLGAGLMGSLGLAPSADIGAHHAVFQPCHGTAPDITGQGIANPLAMILSAGMMLDWLGDRHCEPGLNNAATTLQNAVDSVVAEGQYLTPDLGGSSSTTTVAEAVGQRLMQNN